MDAERAERINALVTGLGLLSRAVTTVQYANGVQDTLEALLHAGENEVVVEVGEDAAASDIAKAMVEALHAVGTQEALQASSKSNQEFLDGVMDSINTLCLGLAAISRGDTDALSFLGVDGDQQ